jgi:hypothetical protein
MFWITLFSVVFMIQAVWTVGTTLIASICNPQHPITRLARRASFPLYESWRMQFYMRIAMPFFYLLIAAFAFYNKAPWAMWACIVIFAVYLLQAVIASYRPKLRILVKST